MNLEKFVLPEKYKTHHTGIDEQHTQLFSILMTMMTLIKNPPPTIDTELNQLLIDLRKYTQNHFKYEERIMEKIQYPKFESHRELHNNFITKMISIQKTAIKNSDEKLALISQMALFVKDWLLEHVLIEDHELIAYRNKIENKDDL